MKNSLRIFVLILFAGLLNKSVCAQVTQRGEKTTSNSLTNTLALSVPQGIQVDDILLVQIVQSDNDNATLSDAMSTGWTQIKGKKVKTNSSREWWATLLFKRVTLADLTTSSYTFTLDADAVGDGSAGEMVAFYGVSWTGYSATGVANSGPFDNVIPSTDYTSNNGNSSNISATAITTSNGGSGILMFSAIGNARYHNTWTLNGVNMTEICDYPNLMAANNGSGIAWRTQLASGTTGAGATHLSKGAGGGAILVSLKSLSSATIVATGSTSFCTGGSVELQANIGAGLTYQWQLNGVNIPGATSFNYIASAPGNYTATVTNSVGAVDVSGIITVVVLSNPQVQIIGLTPIAVCSGSTVTLSSDTYTYAEYLWSVNGVSDPTAIDSVFSISYSANISLQVLSPEGCYGTSNTLAITVSAAQTYFADTDADGFGNVASTVSACAQPTGYVTNSTDCNDSNSNVFPGASELCNSIDDNCDGQVDNGITYTMYYSDLDGDGFGTGAGISSCTNLGGNYVTNNLDCNEANASVNPNAFEICNSIDDECNGQIDNGLNFQTYYSDIDLDGFGAGVGTVSCIGLGLNYSLNNSDCNDSNSSINPNANELCNSIDDNCDGQVDNGITYTMYYSDIDADGFGSGAGISSCSNLGGNYVTNNLDCNDSNASINPNAFEICNSIDDECNGQIDNGLNFQTYYSDGDLDGFGAGVSTVSCTVLGSNYSLNNTDCNDSNANVNPAASELCNSVDDNCDGLTDNGLLFLNYFTDADADTFGTGTPVNSCNDLGAGYSVVDGDCNDADASVNPNATEILDNAIDENCDGQIEMGVEELNSFLNAYPNPASDRLNIQLGNQAVGEVLYVFDSVGKMVFKQQVLSTQLEISLAELNTGNYILKVGASIKRFEVSK